MFLLLYLFFFNKEVSGLASQNIYDVDCYFKYDKGESYNGTVNKTVDEKACINWFKVQSLYTQYYPDHNYCRNPRNDSFDQPWCYTDTKYNTGTCNIAACVCKPGRFGDKCEQICHCKEADCNDLNGHCSSAGCEKEWTGDSCNVCATNRFGEKCERICHCKKPGCDRVTGHCNKGVCEDSWTGASCSECSLQWFGQNCERFCHCQHGECDNITGICYKPGCMKGWTGDSCNYTTDCVLKIHDTTYSGTVNITKTNLPCKRWEHASFSIYRALEENFCRNPSFDAVEYPWCYTESGSPQFQMCAIPICVCQPGFFGENCQSECHCAVDGCNTITGECNNLKAGCKVPWRGRNCSTYFSCPDLQTSLNLLKPTTLIGYHIYDTVKFLCDLGYALSGPDVLKCIINDSHTGGKWSNSQPVCQSIRCSKSSLHLTSNEVMNETTEVFHFREVVNISCKHGFIGETKKSKCVNINKWTSNRPVCRECISNRFGPKCDKHCHCQLGGCDYKTGVCDKPGCAKDWEGASCNFNKSGSCTIPVERDGIYMSYGLFGGVLTTIVLISVGVYIGVCFYHRRRERKHISIYEDLQFKSVQRQTVNNDDTYVELQ